MVLRHQAERVIQPVIEEARVVYQEPYGFRTLLWCVDKMTLEYDAKIDCLIADIAGEESELPCIPASRSSESSTDSAFLLSSMRGYWGNAYEEIMQ